MVFEVDISKLITNLKEAKEVKATELSDGVQYLLEHVYRKLIADNPLTVGDIDFSRFTYGDVQDYDDHLNADVNSNAEKAERIHQMFTKYKPKVISERAFF